MIPAEERCARISYNKSRSGGAPGITRAFIPTSGGNEIMIFYNPENNLLCVDLIDYEEVGGNELFCKYMDEKDLLGHLR
jgi:hypothetical protein